MSNFKDAITVVINTHEGGFQARADDPGNYRPDGTLVGTKYGISARSFPDVDILNLTMDQAVELYQKTYGPFSALTDQRVLTKVLDLAVNMQNGTHGPATAILQRAINEVGDHVTIDGIFGSQTATAANIIDPPILLLASICKFALSHYGEIEAAKPAMKAWFANWNKRAEWLPPQDTISDKEEA